MPHVCTDACACVCMRAYFVSAYLCICVRVVIMNGRDMHTSILKSVCNYSLVSYTLTEKCVNIQCVML